MKVGFLPGYPVAPEDQRAIFTCDLQSLRWLARTQKSLKPQTSWAGQAQISNFREATMLGELCTFLDQSACLKGTLPEDKTSTSGCSTNLQNPVGHRERAADLCCFQGSEETVPRPAGRCPAAIKDQVAKNGTTHP